VPEGGTTAVSPNNEIDIKFDAASQEYYASWEPIVIGTGKTVYETLEDLRQAAHFSIDALIDLKSGNTDTGKGD
jgi:hypothetical protein